MAQQRSTSRKQKKSDFPIFEYLDMVMPKKLVARFMEMPRHLRWTLISSIASLILLWVALRVVVGGLNQWIDSRGEFLYDSYYLPYPLSERPLPVSSQGVSSDNRFLVLPATIADQYVLQIPPTEVEQAAIRKAELDTFLALSQPVETSLTALRQSLSEQLPAVAVVTEMVETAVEVTAAPTTDSAVVSTVVPTVNPIQAQFTAVDHVLASLTSLNQALQASVSIDPVYVYIPQLQNQLNALVASGITLPVEIEPFSQRISELAAAQPSIVFRNSECLMNALVPVNEIDEAIARPCGITQRAMHAEQGDYISADGTSLNVVVAEFPRSVDAGWAVKQLFYRTRKIGVTGDFAMNDIIPYNYFFGQTEGVYTLAWSHQNWVYSVSGLSGEAIDSLMKVFPY
jgi:hypothetical protein